MQKKNKELQIMKNISAQLSRKQRLELSLKAEARNQIQDTAELQTILKHLKFNNYILYKVTY